MIRALAFGLLLLLPGPVLSQDEYPPPVQPQNGIGLFLGAGNGGTLTVNLAARLLRSWSDGNRFFVGYRRWIPGIGAVCDCIAPCPSSACYPHAHELFGGVLSEPWLERSIRPFLEGSGGIVWGKGGDGPAPALSGGGGIRFGIGGRISWRLSARLTQVLVDHYKNPIGNENRIWVVGLGMEIPGLR